MGAPQEEQNPVPDEREAPHFVQKAAMEVSFGSGGDHRGIDA
jgi:hypothetical protein